MKEAPRKFFCKKRSIKFRNDIFNIYTWFGYYSYYVQSDVGVHFIENWNAGRISVDLLVVFPCCDSDCLYLHSREQLQTLLIRTSDCATLHFYFLCKYTTPVIYWGFICIYTCTVVCKVKTLILTRKEWDFPFRNTNGLVLYNNWVVHIKIQQGKPIKWGVDFWSQNTLKTHWEILNIICQYNALWWRTGFLKIYYLVPPGQYTFCDLAVPIELAVKIPWSKRTCLECAMTHVSAGKSKTP